ncbi:cytochrome c biogenesis protein CcsA [Danxiaibacter flavus]|uniref:Cytochrome c biogenesis protein CcsA n=1 Tax=Danxiaibacter flavus TaxID=3049108 RepID=A0ABV3ZB80_9BACT|nr:cytochrome c biogenesis protein CcsA [Chitinophagaceae bacterium DXS]
MNYTGEHLFPGQAGHFFVILSLVASLVATIAYFKANKVSIPEEKQSWIRMARTAFILECISVVAIIGLVAFIISQHYFEYKYAYQHSDRSMEAKYLLSCIWEGQEGSFMLWSFWHCVLGLILIKTSKQHEAGVMTVISLAQFCIATMLLGIYVFNIKIGINPFTLMRNEGFFDNAPVFKDVLTGGLRKDYLSLIRDGSGLNTLLQNYWMVIHPPVLFLGFASTIVPFAFAYSGLVNKSEGWVKPAIPWAAFSGAILGTGIMMGAAWAYEALNFGGYWAWDPVENASLVPWLVIVAGLHTNIVYKSTGHSLRATYLFYILGFILIIYSTFLTRSGILGDTSVHAFTGADMTWQLLSFIIVFTIPSFYLYFKNYKSIPTIRKEESSYSREFWMFIGALVLLLSAVVIIAKTSVPVFNKVFGTSIAPPEDIKLSYNQVQIYVAILIGIFTAVTQYLKYKDTPKGVFGKKIFIPTLISLVISLIISIFGSIHYDEHGIGYLAAIHMAIFAAVYAIVANASYIWIALKGKIKSAGASIAHVGFGLVLLGVLLSSAKKDVLSKNTTGIALFEKTKTEDPAENLTLFKGLKTDMGKYHVTYSRDTVEENGKKRYFQLDFEEKATGKTFSLFPDVLKSNREEGSQSANPDKKHYLNKDIFVYVSSFLDASLNDTTSFQPRDMKVGDTTFFSNGFMVLNKVDVNPPNNKRQVLPGETAMMLNMTVFAKNGIRYDVTPGIVINGNTFRNLEDSVLAQNLVIRFNKVKDEKKGVLEIGVKEGKSLNDIVTLKVYEFPFINVLWIGVIIMVIGFVISVVYRVKTGKSKKSVTKPQMVKS